MSAGRMAGAPPCDFVLRGAGELVTMAPGSVPGAEGELGVVRDGALAARDGRIVWVGPERELASAAVARRTQSRWTPAAPASRPASSTRTRTPSSPARARPSSRRGSPARPTREILASGGGINSTVRATRAASLEELEALTARRLDTFLLHGTTTLEVKSGYGLTTEDELKMLRAARVEHPTRRAYTHLGAHFVPPEYEGRPDEYIDLVCAEMLPAAEGIAEFVDVFCDEGAFTVDQSRRVLQAGEALGMRAKLHADELALSGGSELAAELGCVSADHLVHIGAAEIRALRDAGVVAVMLPGTSFSLGAKYAPARELLAAGAMVALATDFNPGTCYCENMQMAIALACQGMKLTPSQALRAATMGGAAALGRTDQVGSLEAGKWCDLLVLDGEGHHELGYHFGVNIVSEVVVGGRVVVSGGRCEAVPGARCAALRRLPGRHGGELTVALIECVPNFSEGRRPEVIDEIAAAVASVAGVDLLDRQSDETHNRCVLTFVGEPEAAAEAAFRAIAAAARLIDLNQHRGAHPRFGATDVVPFVPIRAGDMPVCVATAHQLGRRVAAELQIPVYFYEEAARTPERRNLVDGARRRVRGAARRHRDATPRAPRTRDRRASIPRRARWPSAPARR